MHEIASYPLDGKRLALAHPGDLGRLEVRFDGKRVGGFGSLEELREGRSFALDDGSSLEVALRRRYLSWLPGLDVRHNGRAVSGSAFDPERNLKRITVVVAIVALANIGIGVYALTDSASALAGDAVEMLAMCGAVLVLLAIGWFRPRVTMFTLLGAAGIFAWATIVGMMQRVHDGVPALSPALFGRLILTIWIVRGAMFAKDRRVLPSPSMTTG